MDVQGNKQKAAISSFIASLQNSEIKLGAKFNERTC